VKGSRPQSKRSGSGRSLTQHSESRSVVDGTVSSSKLVSEDGHTRMSESTFPSKTGSSITATKSIESITGRPASKAESSVSAAKDLEEVHDDEGEDEGRQSAASSARSSHVS